MIKVLTALGIIALSLIVFILAAAIVSLIALGIRMLIAWIKDKRLQHAENKEKDF